MKRLVPWIVYLIFFAVLNETMFNVSTPMIAKQFALSPAGVSWMMTIFMVFFGIGSVIFGRLSDLYSLRRLILIGIVVYNIGSVMGFSLQFSYPLVIAARAVQGIGGSAIPPLVFVVVARYFADSERGKIFGLITSTISFSIGLGPVVGGLVSGSLHWYFLFLIPLLTLVSLPFFSRGLPEEPRREGKVDYAGAGLVAAIVGLLVVYLNFGEWYYLAAFVGALVAFIFWTRAAPEPFIKPSLFKNTKFRNGLAVGFFLFSIVIGIFFLIPLMLSDLHGLNTSRIGFVLFPGAISSVVFGPIAGNLADRKGNMFVVMIGLALLLASTVSLSVVLGFSPIYTAVALLLTYVGFSLFQTAVVNSISQTLSEGETGVGMGLFNLVGIVSGAIGTAVVGKILTSRWLSFSLFSFTGSSRGSTYSNVMIACALVVILGAALYFGTFRAKSTSGTLSADAAER